ncbi:hypothetical protein THRCLA_10819 [Thraustotheca clavata]|uniref:Secreted protein n=1 Tax=Thraustotheca clavata TaxID=74557 RepID=A0A0A7CMP3_9STRA|nr:secreted protein [Thraustotheca clavata]OQR84560.1 hypothetical protein THRCLA_10819 [Thraustotheca clavata]
MKTAFATIALTTVAVSAAPTCSENYSQCNGQNWPFGVCCKDPNFTCNKKNDYLSLCEPKPKQAMELQANQQCAENYSQCNGQNWPFGVCCKDPRFSCNYKNQYLSLCEPKKELMEIEANTQCAENYSQCNGQNWPFGVCCKSANFACKYKNQYLSLCEPKKYEMEQEVSEVNVWQQCGGKDYKGDTACTAGNSCVKVNDWYSQCQPTPPNANQLATWAQCGGSANNFNANGKTCRDADKCLAYNSYYSQCVPK